MLSRADPIIVGGGPAGAAAAILLARAGVKPLLIERTKDSHDPVCGGFLSADTLALLGGLGIDMASLGAHPIHRVRLITGKNEVLADLPFPAMGLSRLMLDATLLQLAERTGAGIERGLAVRHIAETEVKLSDGALLHADAVFLATGKHDLRGARRNPRSAIADPYVGLKTTLSPSPALLRKLAGTIELHLFRRGYAGLLVQEDQRVNLCLSVQASRLRSTGGKPEALLLALEGEAPMLSDRLALAASIGPWASVAGIPYGWRATATLPGLFRIGEQAAVIASLAGDGIAVALSSAHAATRAFLSSGAIEASRFQTNFAGSAARPIHIAGFLKYIAEKPRLARPVIELLGISPALLRGAARLTRVAPY